jgi:hypothetical protein
LPQCQEVPSHPNSGLVLSWRTRLAHVFDDDVPHNRMTRLFNTLLALLIVLNVVAVILSRLA